MNEPILELENISKAFAGIHAVRDVTLSLARGRVLGLIGQNGAGKSTLMNIVGGVVQPDGGAMRLEWRALCADQSRRGDAKAVSPSSIRSSISSPI